MVSFRHRQEVDPELMLYLQEMAERQAAALETNSPRARYFARRRRRRPIVVEEPVGEIPVEPERVILVENGPFSPYRHPLPSARFIGQYATSTPKSRYKGRQMIAPRFEQMYPPMEIIVPTARRVEAHRRERMRRVPKVQSRVYMTPVRTRRDRLVYPGAMELIRMFDR